MGGMVWQPGVSDAVYPTPADLVHDLVALQITEIEDLIDQGVRWIQLDSLSYNQVFDQESPTPPARCGADRTPSGGPFTATDQAAVSALARNWVAANSA